MKQIKEKIALIDVGTNSARLFIFNIFEDQSSAIELTEKQLVRLGDDLFLTRKFSKASKERLENTFKRFCDLIANSGVTRTKAVATSAFREAIDNQEIVSDFKSRFGIEIEIISGEREAELIALGALKFIENQKANVLVIDIGGGSTEISLISQGKIEFAKSLDLGAARVQEVFLKSHPPSLKDLSALSVEINERLSEVFTESSIVANTYGMGTSGSVRALNKMIGRSDQKMSPAEIFGLLDTLKELSLMELRKLPNLEIKRADFILGAGLVLLEISKFFNLDYVQASKCSLIDGLLAETFL